MYSAKRGAMTDNIEIINKSHIAVCFSQVFSRRLLHQNRDEKRTLTTVDCAIWYVEWWNCGYLLGLLPAHLLRSHSLQCVRAWSAVVVFQSVQFLKTNTSQGSVGICLKCGRIFLLQFLAECVSERISFSGQYLAKIWTRDWWLGFFLLTGSLYIPLRPKSKTLV